MKQTNKKGYIIKDTIYNTKTGEVLVYFMGVDDYVQEEPQYCEPYQRKGNALNKVKKEATFSTNKPTKDDCFQYVEGRFWVHNVEIIETPTDTSNEEIKRPTSKNILENIKKEIESESDDLVLDFVGDYDIESVHYLGDCFHEFADNNISVYYCDQFKYYEEHATECEDALLELYDKDSIVQKIRDEGLYNLCCFAGVCGQYNEQTGTLYSEEEHIKKLLVIRYLLKNDIYLFDNEQINDILEQCEDYNIDEGSQLIDLINDKISEILGE